MTDDIMDNDESKSKDLSLNDFSSPRLSRAPLSGSQEQFQSRVFSVNLAINPLIAAASPLLTINTHLRAMPESPELKKLLDDLSHEVKAFENKAFRCGYRSQVILGARYLICALLDETILSSDWGKASTWKETNLLTTFQHEAWGGERFFLILERCAEDPSLYLDVLELGYLCLSLGFQGKYRLGTHDHNELARVIDNLYELIRSQRGEMARRLLIAPAGPPKKKKSRWLLPPWWLVGLIGLGLMVATFVPYYRHLNQIAAPVMSTLRTIE